MSATWASSFGFDNVQIGLSSSLNGTLTNSGTRALHHERLSHWQHPQFERTQFTRTLTTCHNISFTVKFAPTSAGTASGNLTITSNGSNPTLNIPLSGTGVATPGTLGANPTALIRERSGW